MMARRLSQRQIRIAGCITRRPRLQAHYSAGNTITLTLYASEAVTVSGTPT